MQATSQNSVMHLHSGFLCRNIAILTKNNYTPCHASKLAFFVPKICRKLPGLVISHCAMGAKNRFRISQYGRVKGRIKDLFGGNKSNRVVAISNTRPPDSKTGGLTKNNYGGHVMPNTSHTPTIGQFSLSLDLPHSSYIKRFVALYVSDSWHLVIETESGQRATITDNQTRKAKTFQTLDSAAIFLVDQGVIEMTVFLHFQYETAINGGSL